MKELTFDKFHNFSVIRMCNKGPINLEDKNSILVQNKMNQYTCQKPNIQCLLSQLETTYLLLDSVERRDYLMSRRWQSSLFMDTGRTGRFGG